MIRSGKGPDFRSSSWWSVATSKWVECHFNVNSLLPIIEELRNIAKLSNAVLKAISELKLDDSVLSCEIRIDNYNTLRCDWNRHGRGVICYIRSDSSYDVKSFFPSENVFFEILLPNMKPMVAGIIYFLLIYRIF